MLEFPIPVVALEKWLPHRAPMLWIDQVTGVSADGGECRVLIEKDAGFMDNNGVRPSGMVEWLAQAYACVRVCQRLTGINKGTETLSNAYLVGIRQFEIMNEEVPRGGSVIIRVKTLKELEGLI